MSADTLREKAARLDAVDPLRHCRELYVPAEGLVAYLDGNSLGRPLRATARRLTRLVEHDWGSRLIRSWEEQWMELPLRLGDRIGAVCLGAAPGQTVIGDSTTVMLYKLLRAALAAAGPDRPEIVLDTANFPTDRYVAEGIAAETGAELVWFEPDPAKGVTPDLVAAALGDRTGVVLLSHVAYTSAWVADLPAITRLAHDAGALVLWDLCHSVGVVPGELDAHGVDLAVGCTYKFLGGGPGSPAFGYVAARHQAGLRQPIQGWMGHAEPFAMGPRVPPRSGDARLHLRDPAGARDGRRRGHPRPPRRGGAGRGAGEDGGARALRPRGCRCPARGPWRAGALPARRRPTWRACDDRSPPVPGDHRPALGAGHRPGLPRAERDPARARPAEHLLRRGGRRPRAHRDGAPGPTHDPAVLIRAGGSIRL